MSCNDTSNIIINRLYRILFSTTKHSILNKRLFTAILTILVIVPYTLKAQEITPIPQNQGQDFQQALNLYKQNEYQKAAQLFSKINTDEALLFTGKSYYGSGNFLLAKSYLTKSLASQNIQIHNDAVYTLALCDFQLHNFAESLDRLYTIMNQVKAYDIQGNARQFYNQILDYLTLQQRKDVFSESNIPQVQMDVVTSVFNKVDKVTASSLLQSLKMRFTNTPDSSIVQQLENKATLFNNYATYQPDEIHLKAPDGISYSLGVALPKFEKDMPEYKVSQAIYNGIQLAVEQFNAENTNRKVFIHYHNTLKSDSLTRDIMTDFAWNDHADMIIGPLYSEMAATMAPMAEQYQIPLLAPLANSDSLNFDNPYVFQANPTYTVRGKKMADFAVNRLHLDTLGVIVDKNSFGMHEAFAFRDEAERLGAKVRYFFSANFEKQGFNVSQYTKYFTSDTTMIDSLHIKPVDAVYLPMTGSTAKTLIKLIFTDFEANKSNVTILGSQEWADSGLEPESIKNFNIFYSGINMPDQGLTEVQDFEAQYNNRFGISANRFAIIGYNCAKYLLDTLKKVQNPALLKEALKGNNTFKGISSHFVFDGTHINQAVEFYHLTPKGHVNVGVAN